MSFPAVSICNVNQIDCHQTYNYIISRCKGSPNCPLSEICTLFGLAHCSVAMGTYNKMLGGIFLTFDEAHINESCSGEFAKLPPSMDHGAKAWIAELTLHSLNPKHRFSIAQDPATLVKRCTFLVVDGHPACQGFLKGLQVCKN